jgi:hypothetical protein
MNICVTMWCPEHVRDKKQKGIYIIWFQIQRDTWFFNSKRIKIILENIDAISSLEIQINMTLQYIRVQAFTNFKGTY